MTNAEAYDLAEDCKDKLQFLARVAPALNQRQHGCTGSDVTHWLLVLGIVDDILETFRDGWTRGVQFAHVAASDPASQYAFRKCSCPPRAEMQLDYLRRNLEAVWPRVAAEAGFKSSSRHRSKRA